jgi:hypothetical protein
VNFGLKFRYLVLQYCHNVFNVRNIILQESTEASNLEKRHLFVLVSIVSLSMHSRVSNVNVIKGNYGNKPYSNILHIMDIANVSLARENKYLYAFIAQKA